jgi:glutathione synthase/RimK-type ligase-like ATP-grasp enzyme
LILIAGIPSEPPLAMVMTELSKLSIPYITFNQREFADIQFMFEILNDKITGSLVMHDRRYRLEDIRGVYSRIMDEQTLPELQHESPTSNKRRYCRALHDALIRWCEINPARVINRVEAMGSNSSKPYQSQIINEHGFYTPETIITNQPDLVLDFLKAHKKIVYKSISGVRSIVHTFDEKDLERLECIRWCPVQFQEYIEGTNVRVHVVNNKAFSTSVDSDVTDYRYAHTEGNDADLKAIDLPEDVEHRCIKLSRTLGLAFSGIDLKITPDNKIVCFEVNPSPGFSYYEVNTGQPIARTVARYLAGIE